MWLVATVLDRVHIFVSSNFLRICRLSKWPYNAKYYVWSKRCQTHQKVRVLFLSSLNWEVFRLNSLAQGGRQVFWTRDFDWGKGEK